MQTMQTHNLFLDQQYLEKNHRVSHWNVFKRKDILDEQ